MSSHEEWCTGSHTGATCRVEPIESRPRYFAIIVRGDDSLGNVLCASTELGNWIRAHLMLPEGFIVTRSIEISKGMAEKTW